MMILRLWAGAEPREPVTPLTQDVAVTAEATQPGENITGTTNSTKSCSFTFGNASVEEAASSPDPDSVPPGAWNSWNAADLLEILQTSARVLSHLAAAWELYGVGGKLA